MIPMKNTNMTNRPGYTLIEILVSVTLSLMLMLGVTQMFRGVGDTINDTQATLNMAANLNSTAIVLRNDLGLISTELANKASDLVKDPLGPDAGTDGYLEIIEGQGAPLSVINTNSITSSIKYNANDSSTESHSEGKHIPPYWTAYTPESSNGDRTVGDTDDILAFTVDSTAGWLFSGLIGGQLAADETMAEVCWFVRGTNLYRRVLLIKGHEATFSAAGNYRTEDVSINPSSAANDITALADKRNRFGRHTCNASFPFPMSDDWYYLRMPTLEETVAPTWSIGGMNSPNRSLLKCGNLVVSNTNASPPPSEVPVFPKSSGVWGDGGYNQFWDFWESPNNWSGLDPVTGSLDQYTEDDDSTSPPTPRHIRAGEDIILTNVIGFDVKVWNPYWVPCGSGANPWEWAPPQFVDLGQDRFYLQDNNGVWDWYDVKYDQDLTTPPTGIPAYNNTPVIRDKTNVAGYGFTLKGRYNTVDAVRRTLATGTDKWHEADRIRDVTTPGSPTYSTYSGTTGMACVYDSWSQAYLTNTSINGLTADQRGDPPYAEPITGIQVTIRCFDPRSGNIRQVRVTRNF